MAKGPGLHEPIGQVLRTDGPDFDAMSDEELLGWLERDESRDKYAVQHLAPDGMTYQWVRCEVFGKPDYDRVAEVEQKGWRSVPQKRHDGRFMPAGTDGPTVMDGLTLYELPTRVYRLKREVASRAARNAVGDMNEQLIYSPPGTGPRGTHNYTKPVVHREAGSMPMIIE